MAPKKNYYRKRGIDLNDKNNPAISSPNVEQDSSDESVAEKEAKGLNPRFSITVTSYRKRKHDPDGISVKAVLDGLVRRGILIDDSTSEIEKVTFRSEITKEEEKTVIELT